MNRFVTLNIFIYKKKLKCILKIKKTKGCLHNNKLSIVVFKFI